MNGMRKLIGLMMVAIFAAFALPAIAHGDDEKYTLKVVAGGTTTSGTFTATITNVADDSDVIRSFKIIAPPGATISAASITGGTGTSSGSTRVPASFPPATSSVTFKNVSIARTKNLVVTLTATLPAATACGANPYVWDSTAWEYSTASGETFRRTSSDADRTTYVTNLGVLSLAFVSPPTSVQKDAAFAVTVKQTSTCSSVTLPTVPITLTGNPSFTVGSGAPSGSQTTFTGNKFGVIGPATLTASASGYSNAVANLTVFTETAAGCGTPTAPLPGSTFSASGVCGAPNVNVTGFAEGFRGPNKAGTCNPLLFTLTNNICNTVSQLDANGKSIPPNAVSFVWDQSSQAAAFTYTVTWKPEYVDPATRLPRAAKTKYCSGTGATPCDIRKVLKACIATAVAVGSIPAGEPACVSEEDWTTVPQGDCASLPIQPNPLVACIRITTTIIDAVDPPVIRDE